MHSLFYFEGRSVSHVVCLPSLHSSGLYKENTGEDVTNVYLHVSHIGGVKLKRVRVRLAHMCKHT